MDLAIVRNDITEMDVDAIVLPANSELKEGSGASAAIFNKAGRNQLKAALKRYGHVKVGYAVPTLGYNLQAKYIVHTVVPAWIDGKHDEYLLLSAAYISAMRMADNMDCKSIAFPLLASGNNGFDIELALDIAFKSIETYEPENGLATAYLVLYGMNAMQLAQKRGHAVDKQIEHAYVLEHTEDQVPQTKLHVALRQGMGFGQQLADDAFDKAMAWLNDPANGQRILDGAAEVIGRIAEEAVEMAKDAARKK